MAIEARQDNQSSDAGLLLVREVLERAGLFDELAARLDDPRDQARVTYPLADNTVQPNGSTSSLQLPTLTVSLILEPRSDPARRPDDKRTRLLKRLARPTSVTNRDSGFDPTLGHSRCR